MAEIKSTIDLVMEKTRHMIMSDEERRGAQRAEHMEKVPGYAHKVLEGIWKPEQVGEALEQVPEPFFQEVRKALIREILRRLMEDEPVSTAVPALEAVIRNEERGLLDELNQALEAYRSEAEQLENGHHEALLSELEKLGIRGDAIHLGSADDASRREAARQALRRRIQAIEAAWLAGTTP
ncbi:hypothetical protein SAMN02746041_02112 [Desulfacinum hydrothermale DSM 13146]|uniref:Uncharacterized protein n=1 Tax=Desulfacinum hydrothermale DSM 13146 TaxID=1121390 RepID=A0A1W1XLN3_9BACT|nr:hypothetical protein [Desulfacinum hydrothermale]SMC24853.1 hypothetical protein SAMN02746041_02112 [Desulfacinum hydrothermale DSM 13146]